MHAPSVPEAVKNASILIIDDEIPNIRLLEIVLQQAGFTNVHSSPDSSQAIRLYHEIQPDLILLDLHMPPPDGFTLMELLKPLIHESRYLPILVLTADITPQAKRLALASGAKDFLTKPVDRVEVLLRVTNLLETRLQNTILDARVRERTQWLEEARLEISSRLALAAEYRDDDTGLHTKRVGVIATQLAMDIGLPLDQVALMEQAAQLHDVGKIGISDTILLKPGKLTPEEFEIMKSHTTIGAKILSGSASPWLQMAEIIALTHHERWDGTGYPQKLAGEAIPLEGRILAIVDVFDALTHDRPYKEAWPVVQAVAEIERQSGRQFEPRIVEAFLHLDHEALI